MASASDVCEISYKELLTSGHEDEDHLGEGGFGVVLRCYHKEHGSVAVKLMQSSDRIHTLKNKCSSGNFNNEICLHNKAFCKHVVGVIGYTRYMQTLGIILEYMPMGNLLDVIKESHILPCSFKIRALYEISSALNHLHNLNELSRMTHNDIKPENILFDSNLHAKVSDFGGASFGKHTAIKTLESVTRHGARDERISNAYTLVYAAPELLNNDVCNTPRSCSMDIYSFGLVTFCILYEHQPYEGKSAALVKNAINKNQRPEGDPSKINGNSLDNQIYQRLSSIMKQMWNTIPTNRPNIAVIRDEFASLLEMYSKNTINNNITTLKRSLDHSVAPESDETSRVNVIDKYKSLGQSEGNGRSNTQRTPVTHRSATVIEKTITDNRNEGAVGFSRRIDDYYATDTDSDLYSARTTPRKVHGSPTTSTIVEDTSHASNNIINLFDPKLNVDDRVVVKCGSNDIENARNISGVDLSKLRGKCGKIIDVIKDEELCEVCIDNVCYVIQSDFLEKVQSSTDLSVGDVVRMSLEQDIVKQCQKDHGGWSEDMEKYFNEPGLVFRFFTNKSDILVIYRDAKRFRFNSSVLEKVDDSVKEKFLQSKVGDLSVGNFVYFSMDIGTIKLFQDGFGGWADDMEPLRNRVGIVVYVDYSERVYVAYSSKLCFMFNPAIFTQISSDEAVRWNSELEKKAKKAVQAKLMIATRTKATDSNFKVGDKVKVCLPVDIVIPIQKESGGWLYPMLEVYGKCGTVIGFNHKHDVQISFKIPGSSPSRWTFSRTVLAEYDAVISENYMPPVLVGDRVRVNISTVIPDLSENQLIYQLQSMDFSDDKIDALTQCGTVLGIDDDLDAVVKFDSGRTHWIKPIVLQKIE